MTSVLWRFSVGNIESVSAAAMERGPAIALSSDSSTKLYRCLDQILVGRSRNGDMEEKKEKWHTMDEPRIQQLFPCPSP